MLGKVFFGVSRDHQTLTVSISLTLLSPRKYQKKKKKCNTVSGTVTTSHPEIKLKLIKFKKNFRDYLIKVRARFVISVLHNINKIT